MRAGFIRVVRDHLRCSNRAQSRLCCQQVKNQQDFVIKRGSVPKRCYGSLLKHHNNLVFKNNSRKSLPYSLFPLTRVV